MGFPGGSVVKILPDNLGNTGDVSSIPGSGRPPGGGNGNPLQYSCLENRMDGGAWWATVHEVTESRTQLKQLSTSVCCCYSFTQPRPVLCNPMDCSTPGLPVPHHLPEFVQVHVHCISDAVQPPHPLTHSSSSAFNLSQHQGLFQ